MMKAVLFDLDGTLIDSSEGIIKSAQYALTHFGIEETDMQNLMSFIGPPLAYSFKNRYGFSEEKAREAVGVYRERYTKIGIFECSLYPGVRECIEQLKAMGYLIGMASSKPEESCRRILEHFDLIDLFDDVVGSTPDGKIDTKEQVLSEVMRRWHEIPTTEMCLIGDTIFDVEGANEKEIPCICVSYGFGDVEEMLAAGALKICDSMSELPQAIAEL
jgi:phosphoglycolate phosphatase